MSESGLQFAFNLCKDFLRLKTRPDVGMTLIVSPKWMFLSVITQPYCSTEQGFPVFLDGLSFAGLVSLQNSVPSWPATAGLIDNTHTIFGALSSSTFIRSVTVDDKSD